MVYRDRARPTGTAADDRARVRGVHLGRTGHDPCTVDGRRTRGRARRTTGPVVVVVVVVVRTRRHGRERVQGGRRGRVGERKDRTREEEREDTGARRARGRRDRGMKERARARGGAFERGGRTTTDGGV
jgi:hypothetical protein